MCRRMKIGHPKPSSRAALLPTVLTCLLVACPVVAAAETRLSQSANLPSPTESGRSKAEDLWSLRPLLRPQIPLVRIPGIVIRNPIDQFIVAKLEEIGL